MDENRKQPDDEIDVEIQRALDGLPADFSGFDRHYQDVIRPQLRARETDRMQAAQKARQGKWYGIAIGIAGVVLVLFLVRVPFLAIGGVMAGMGTYGFMRRDISQISREAKTLMVQPVAERLNLDFAEACGDQALVHEMRSLKLLPGWDRSEFEDKLTGVRNGVEFEFFEAHLEQKRSTRDGRGRTQTRWVTVFRGQCLRFDLDKAFYGTTLVLRDAGLFNGLGGVRGTKRARMEDPVFEKAFEVHTTDQVESRFLLTPDVMQDLVDLEKAFHGGKIRCAFDKGQVLIAVEGGDLFEPGGMFTPLDNPERIRDLLEDFGSVFQLIDALSKKDRTHRQGGV
jgi:hypothetical protein